MSLAGNFKFMNHLCRGCFVCGFVFLCLSSSVVHVCQY